MGLRLDRWVDTEDRPGEPIPPWVVNLAILLVGVCIGYLIWG